MSFVHLRGGAAHGVSGPSNVRFVFADAEWKLLVKSDGVYRSQKLVIIKRERSIREELAEVHLSGDSRRNPVCCTGSGDA